MHPAIGLLIQVVIAIHIALPLGTWLDRHGPKKVALGFLGEAVVGIYSFHYHFRRYVYLGCGDVFSIYELLRCFGKGLGAP